MDKARKKYVQIDKSTTSEYVFALLDTIESEDEQYIDEMMNDSDTELFAEDDGTLEAVQPNNEDKSKSSHT